VGSSKDNTKWDLSRLYGVVVKVCLRSEDTFVIT
jgi:hypothetical protein